MVRRIFRWVGDERVTLAAVCRRSPGRGAQPDRQRPLEPQHDRDPAVELRLRRPGRFRQDLRACAAVRPARGRAGVPKRPSRPGCGARAWITIPVPAIIDEGLFESAREQLAENRRRNRQRLGGRYLLQGLLVCHKCGYAYYGKTTPLRAENLGAVMPITAAAAVILGVFDDRGSAAIPRSGPTVWMPLSGRRSSGCLRTPTGLRASTSADWTRRTAAAMSGPMSPRSEAQMAKLRRGIGRLMDSYAEGMIDESGLRPRMSWVTPAARTISRIAARVCVTRRTVQNDALLDHRPVGGFAHRVRDTLYERATGASGATDPSACQAGGDRCRCRQHRLPGCPSAIRSGTC